MADQIRKWLADPLWPQFGPGIGPGPLDPGRHAARAAATQCLDVLDPLDPFEREAVIAELEVVRTEVGRLDRLVAGVQANYMAAQRQAERHLMVKQNMHRRLTALYRKTKAERDMARAWERQRILANVKAMGSGCHSYSGLNCDHDWFDGGCGVIDGHEVIKIIEGDQ
jgi:hypothetical protein